MIVLPPNDADDEPKAPDEAQDERGDTADLPPPRDAQQLMGTSAENLLESEVRYRLLLNSIDIAFCLIEMRFDAQGKPYDYLFLETNPAFERHTGLLDSMGKTIRELAPDIDKSWFPIYGNVSLTGEAVRFENHDPALSRWFDVYAQRVGSADERKVGIFFTDITARKLLEQERESLLGEQERMVEGQRALLLEQARLLEELRVRAEHESILNQISAAVRATLDPEEILRATVSTLGERLGADRCYFVRGNPLRDAARVSPEWLRAEAGLEPLSGRTFPMSAYPTNRDAAYQAGHTHVLSDVGIYGAEQAAPLLAIQIRALLRVSIHSEGQMTALSVAMAAPRQWTVDEVRLIENVSALVRSALESARVQQRERNISQQLQDALQPPVPDDLPGLALASYYRPALAEASVGGDFFDVFPLDDGCAALVVADLSGKGLQAASQVATVRNMLRYALYSNATLAEAVTGLHRALETHHLLTGFATLLVGVFDEEQNTFTYVNCGQEPGLIWRKATGDVQSLAPTGPVLGGFGTGDFEQAVVSLSEGDVIALFTDGLTEVGPSRKVQLEVEGVMTVLRECCAAENSGWTHPWSIAESLIAGVDDFARGGVRDDIALLVGIVGPRPRNLLRKEGWVHRPHRHRALV